MRKQKKNFREQGITLVALVVTIIVLLVLAGVTVSMVLNNNGIIERSKSAKQEYEVSSQKEQNSLNEVGTYLESINSTPKAPFDPANVTEIGTPICSKEDIGKTIVDKSTKEPISATYTVFDKTTTTKWKLYYQDSNYTYIIADNQSQTLYPGYSNEKGTSDIIDELKFLNKTWFDALNGKNSTNMNATATAFFMNQNKWTTNVENAKYIIGATTIDLIKASYQYTTGKSVNFTADESGYNNWGGLGSKDSFSYDMVNGIYGTDCTSLWIASPTGSSLAEDPWYMQIIDGSYSRLYTYLSTGTPSGSFGSRPVVLIPTSEFNYDLK